MQTGIRNLIGALLLIFTVGLSSCLALTEAGAAAQQHAQGAER